MKALPATLRFVTSLAFCCAAVWAQTKGYSVQVSSVPSEAEAQAAVKRLRAKGLAAYRVKAQVPGKGVRYRIRFGHFTTKEKAQQEGEQALRQQIISEFLIADYEAPTGPAREKEARPAPSSVAERKSPSVTPKETAPARPLAPAPRALSPSDLASVPPKVNPKAQAPDPVAEKTGRSPGRSRWASDSHGATREGRTDATPQREESRIVSGSTSLPVGDRRPPVAPSFTPELARPATAKHSAGDEPGLTRPPLAEATARVEIDNPSWQVVRPSERTEQNLRAIYFVDSLTGWVAGDRGTVYRTNDGGQTWKPLLSPVAADITRLQFVDWNTGWMIGETIGEGGEGPQTALLSTTDGGRTWRQKAFPHLAGFYFVDGKTGWAVGKNATLLKTVDGGGEWKRYEGIEKLIGKPVEPSAYNFGFCDVFFLDASHGWVVGNFYGRARDHIGGLFVTADGGTTWKRLPLAVLSQPGSKRPAPGLLHSVRFTDATTGSVTGEMYEGDERFFFVARTKDAGKSWQLSRTPSRARHSTQFVDLAHGWTAAAAPRQEGGAAVYDTTLLRTEDGGASWQSDLTAHGRQLRGVFFLSPSKGWAVGDRGLILRYEDRAKTQGLGARN